MVTWKIILAAMLFLQAPGKSIYSKVNTTESGAPSVSAEINGTTGYKLLDPDEEAPLQCQQDNNVACYKPRLRDIVFNGWNIDKTWQRTETYDEGLQRYAVLAHAIEDVLRSKKWNFPVGQSWQYLVAIAYHESGFRRDIHSGHGSAALGDCKWRRIKSGKKEMVPGTCKSYGPFQTLFPKPKTSKHFGFRPKDLIGVDIESSMNAVEVAVRHLERVHKYCMRVGPRPFSGCIFATYGGLSNTRDPRIVTRVGTLSKVKNSPRQLNDYVIGVLESTDGSSASSTKVASRKE